MATADKRTNFFDKRIMSKQDFDNYFFTYLNNKINDVVESAFLSESGVLSADTIDITATTKNTFTLDISNASRGVDGNGNIMDLSLLSTTDYELRDFENANGIDYYVGFRYQTVPSGVQRNPRLTIPSYSYYEDTIGELGNPDSVVDNTTYIRLTLNSILESGVDHTGRPVTVYLNIPVSPENSIAFYTGLVAYSAPNNYVDIPYTPTAGPLGQTAPNYPISTTAADYWVHAKGVSWFKNSDLRIDSNYVFVGIITGNDTGGGAVPVTFDISDQISALYMSLDNAYRAGTATDPAPGRTINVNKKSVVFTQSNSTVRDQDYSNTILDLNSFGSTATSTNIRAQAGYSNRSEPLTFLKSVSDGAGNNLEATESVTLSSGLDTITLGRGAADLTAMVEFLGDQLDFWFVLIEGSAAGVDDGLYLGDQITAATTCTVKNLDGTAVTFSSASVCTAKFFIPTEFGINRNWTNATYTNEPAKHISFAKSQNGLVLEHRGDLLTNNPSKFLEGRIYDTDGISNIFFKLASKDYRTGGKLLNVPYDKNGEVVGTAANLIDKTNTTGLVSDFQPADGYGEWGYDYRGSRFGLIVSASGPYQLGFTSRIPYYSADVLTEEIFIQYSSSELNMNGGTFDNTNMPFGANNSGSILAEVQFDTPHAADGVYVCWAKSSSTIIEFKKLDGSSPSFPSFQPGVIRFYSGVFNGNLPSNNTSSGGTTGYLQTISVPNGQTGGQRISHYTSDVIGSTDYKFLSAFFNLGTIGWGVRDGGVMYARAITTKAPAAGHGLTQWDQIESSLITGTNITASGTLTGTTTVTGGDAYFTTLQLSKSTYDVVFPTDVANTDVFKKSGGGSWTVNRRINLFGGLPTWSGGVTAWAQKPGASSVTGDLRAIISYVASGQYVIQFIPPQGATISSFIVDWKPADASGTMSFNAFRAPNGTIGATALQLRSGGAVTASAAAAAESKTYTCDQWNTNVDNEDYQYYVHIKGSTTTADEVYSIYVTYTVATVGQNLFGLA